MINKSVSLVTTQKRLLIALMSITFLFCAIFGRLFYVQIISGAELKARATNQWYRDLPLIAPRGIIYDANGKVLADNRDVYTVYVRPSAVTDVNKVASVLSNALKIDENALKEKMKKRVSEITVKKNVLTSVAEPIKQLGLNGVYFSAGTMRNYPSSNYLANVIGFTNVDNVGQAGLEGYYNKLLTGVNGIYYEETDNAGREIAGSVKKYVPSIRGCDLSLTIDLNVQSFAETAVSNAVADHNALSASMIVMDVNSGAVLAMASAPGYDLNSPPRNDVALLNALTKNSMIVDVYEPGSTFKIFTTATAIERGVVSDSNRFYCSGSRTVDGQRIKCWRSIGHGSQDLSDGVKNSCNCVFMDLAVNLGVDKLYNTLSAFGFGKKTGIDFYGESSGIMMKSSSVKTVDLARIGFGQAIAVTPLQLISGVCSAVNGGNLYEPYLLQRAVDYRGETVYSRSAKIISNPISEKTSEKLRVMLERVVSEGSGKKAQIGAIKVGGKTGTAQKYSNGVIAQGKYVSSFVGFAPADKPEYAVLMIVNEPNSFAYYGSIVATPYAGEVLKKIFDYKGVNVDFTPYEPTIVMPDLIDKTVTESVEILKSLGLSCEVAGDDETVTSTVPIANVMISENEIVLLRAGE